MNKPLHIPLFALRALLQLMKVAKPIRLTTSIMLVLFFSGCVEDDALLEHLCTDTIDNDEDGDVDCDDSDCGYHVACYDGGSGGNNGREVILLGGDHVDLTAALEEISLLGPGGGTITIKGNIDLSSTVPPVSSIDIPFDVTLNFFTGNVLIVGDTTLNIYGTILAGNNQIFDVPKNHAMTIYNQTVYPEWFGSCSYQDASVTNDAPHIQMAIQALTVGGHIEFIGAQYLVAETIVVEATEGGIRITGLGTYYSASSMTNVLKATDANVSSILRIDTFGVRISGLGFARQTTTQKGIDAVGMAVDFTRSDGHKDLDASVINCMFQDFAKAIHAEGANLKVSDSTFTACHTGIDVDEAGLDQTNHQAQTRGHVITGNRFHSMGSLLQDDSLKGSACVKIWASTGYSFPDPYNPQNPESYTVSGHYNHITDNYADDCKTFFEGSVDRSMISGNSIFASGDTAIKALAGQYGVISNNLIDGSTSWNPHKLYPYEESDPTHDAFPNGHGIHLKDAHHISVHNNQIHNKRYHGIYVERSTGSSLQSNIIMDFNRHAYIRYQNSGGTHVTEATADLGRYSGIHIDCTAFDAGIGSKLNVSNVVSGNQIGMPFSPVGNTAAIGRYGVLAGDGDALSLIADNFIVTERLQGCVPIIV